ncbi:type II secretion system protein GspD [Endozoicomonas sp. OPT23]|uniref:type II secretion system secretin GspD n=1 Tax=Endozoicomonas sp. OPT23 TaxID=2072845 RepID=UPI00129A4688|nr:type II secretion system secretin GspD [Endozoicomonas sp. OPT23]MRI34395.1 type II secretion system protein GspD [Endozoicomonas sp. OPT23]
MRRSLYGLLASLLLSTAISNTAVAQGYSASFNKANITEFIDTVSITLGRTILTDPSVKGSITIRTHNELTEEQYYQLFLSVLELHGYSVIPLKNDLLKVVKSKKSKETVFPLTNPNGQPADSMVTWVVAVNNVPTRELAPLLRQMNANYGTVVNFNPSNILIITGRASNVERMVSMVQQIDQVGAKSVAVVTLSHTSAKEMARILTSIYLDKNAKSTGMTNVVANEQGNQVILSGTPEMLSRMKKLARQLDAERSGNSGNDKVFYLRYARAASLKEVLENAASVAQSSKNGTKSYSITAHEDNNALVITAQPELMKSLSGLIAKLDIRRAQVMVEAIIAEVSDADGIDLSLQLAGKNGSLVQFNDGKSVPIGEILAGVAGAQKQKGTTTQTVVDGNIVTTTTPDKGGDFSSLAKSLARISGSAIAVSSGDWAALVQAVAASTQSNVLSTPSLMTLDNQPASFVVGNEVPTITGSTSGSNNDNPYQTITRRQVGVKLHVTPQINEGDAVRLDIEQEVSKVNGRTAVDVTFSTREVKTSVMVRSGDTVVISGMMDDDVQESKSKVPLLGDIPVLGHLFRSTSSKTIKRNLMVFIRPTIIRDDEMMKQISANKYSLIRAAQIRKSEDGIDLMPDTRVPVLPELTFEPQSSTETSSTAQTKEASEPVRSERLQYHAVEAGNTLYSIARHYGTTVGRLRNMNGLQGNELSVGQKLVVAREIIFLNKSSLKQVDDEAIN